MDLGGICAAIAAAAKTAGTPAGGKPLTATSYVPDAITEPHFFVAEPEIDYDKTFGRTAELQITCRLLVGRQDDQAGQAQLRAYLSTGTAASVKDAIESARGGPGQPALGGLADDLWVRRVERPRYYEHSGTQYYGVDIQVRVVE
jgi:hypothetical protein